LSFLLSLIFLFTQCQSSQNISSTNILAATITGGSVGNYLHSQQRECLTGGAGTVYFQFIQDNVTKGVLYTWNKHEQTLAASPLTTLPFNTYQFRAENVIIYGGNYSFGANYGCLSSISTDVSSSCSIILFLNSTVICHNQTLAFNPYQNLAYYVTSCGLMADIVNFTSNSHLHIYANDGFYGSGQVFQCSTNSKISFTTDLYLNFTKWIEIDGTITQTANNQSVISSNFPSVSLHSFSGNISVSSITANRVFITGGRLSVSTSSHWKPLGNNAQNCLSDFNASSVACGGGADISLIPYLRSVEVDKSITIGSYSSIIGSFNLFCAYAFNLQYNATISADGMGCNPMNGSGAGLPGFYGKSGGGGAGYGGSGGTGYNNNNINGGGNYDETGYLYSGSGGGCSVSGGENCDAGSYGGGMIAIFAKQKITLNGTISANGFNGVGCSGGGSGGSISVITDTLTGVGVITTNGGNGGTCPWPGGGGGGGYVEIYSPSGAYSSFDLKGASLIASNGGAAGVQPTTSDADYAFASLSSYSSFNVHSRTNARRKSADFLQGVTQAEAGTAGVLLLPSCQPGHGNDASTGAICVVCPTGTYSNGGDVDCSNCNNKPLHSFYTESGWSNSNCPFQCESGYITDYCDDGLRIFFMLLGISLGSFVLFVCMPLFYYQYKRTQMDTRNEKIGYFEHELMSLEKGAPQVNKGTCGENNTFLTDNPLRVDDSLSTHRKEAKSEMNKSSESEYAKSQSIDINGPVSRVDKVMEVSELPASTLSPSRARGASRSVSHEPSFGVNLSFLNHFVEENNISMEMTTMEVVEKLIKLQTVECKSTYITKILHRPEYFSDLRAGYRNKIGKTNTEVNCFFLSHCWQMPFRHLINIIENAIEIELDIASHFFVDGREQKIAIEYYFWIDVFCKNQHSPAPAMDEFKRAMNDAGDEAHLLIFRFFICSFYFLGQLVIALWPRNPVAITRIWCLYELWCAIADNIPIKAGFIDDDRRSLVRNLCLVENPELFKVNVMEAQATKQEDIVQILGQIAIYPGVDEMDRRILSDFSTAVLRYTLRARTLLRFCVCESFGFILIFIAYLLVMLTALSSPGVGKELYLVTVLMFFCYFISFISIFLLLMKNFFPRRSPKCIRKISTNYLIVLFSASFFCSFGCLIIFYVLVSEMF
jgi:hypothetical protein